MKDDLIEMHKRNLIATLNANALQYADANLNHYASYSREELQQWARATMWNNPNNSSLLLQPSDSLLSADIINHLKRAAHNIVELMALQHKWLTTAFATHNEPKNN